MNVLGIEIKGSDCICILLSGSSENFSIEEFPKKISINDSYSTAEINSFYEKMKQLVTEKSITKVAVKKRTEKGKFAGGALSFKMEGLVQLAAGSETVFYSGSQLNAFLKKSPADSSNLNKYQHQAFYTAFCCLCGG